MPPVGGGPRPRLGHLSKNARSYTREYRHRSGCFELRDLGRGLARRLQRPTTGQDRGSESKRVRATDTRAEAFENSAVEQSPVSRAALRGITVCWRCRHSASHQETTLLGDTGNGVAPTA